MVRGALVRIARRLAGGDESGIFEILSALLALVVLSAVFSLGFESTRVKQASQELRFRTESMCRTAAEHTTIQTKAVEIFDAQYSELIGASPTNPIRNIIPGSYQATLFIPTAPQTPRNFFTSPQTCPETDQYPRIDGPCPGASSPSLICKTDFCAAKQTASETNYPDTLVHNKSAFGAVLGCEIRANVRRVWWKTAASGIPIVARVMWSRTVRGAFPKTDLEQGTNPQYQAASLTIAVGTELQAGVPPAATFDDFYTRSIFSFGGTFALGNYNNTFKTQYDPFHDYSDPSYSAPPPGFTAFKWSIPDGVGANVQPANAQYPAGGAWSSKLPGFNIPGPAWVDQVGSAEFTHGRAAMVSACQNPVVMVRNTFLSVITELASRHGQLRNRTEILHINPRHHFRAGGSYNGPQPSPNHPTRIVRFGEDLAAQSYQLPFVQFVSDSFGEWLNPLASRPVPTGPATPKAAAEYLVAAQLRFCYSLYDGPNPNIGRFTDLLDDVLANGSYEVESTSGGPYQPKLQSLWSGATKYVPGLMWDQANTWSATPPSINARWMNAPEVMASLGTTQMCPIPASGIAFGYGAAGPGGSGSGCIRPTPDEDLKPDLVGLYDYLTAAPHRDPANPSAGFTTIAGSSAFRAVERPGYFPVTNPANLAAPDRFFYPYDTAASPANYSSPIVNSASHVLIVLNTPPPESDKSVIQNLQRLKIPLPPGGEVPEVPRTVTVVYFPTNANDARGPAVQRLKEIFDIPDDDHIDDDNVANALYVFSPWDERYDPGSPEASSSFAQYPKFTGSDDDRLRNYWLYMLGQSTNQEENIASSAENIFYKRILHREIRY